VSGQTSCNHAPAGKYVPGNLGTSFTDCQTGKYTSDSQQSSCKLCVAGQIQPNTGKTKCNNCPIGRSIHTQGQTVCPYCSIGKYQSVFGGNTSPTQCQGNCDPGFHCPVGSVSKTQENCPLPNVEMSEWANYYCSGGGNPRSKNSISMC
jgi:hypothetical protein